MRLIKENLPMKMSVIMSFLAANLLVEKECRKRKEGFLLILMMEK
jgi:hypothetical protein